MKNFSLTRQKARLTSFNPRAEHHGEETVPAADLKLEVSIGNEELAMFHHSLKNLLYFYDPQIAGDLVDVAKKDEDKTYAPHLRMPRLVTPIKWDDEIVGGEFTIHYGASQRSDIVLETVNVNNFVIEPQQGGTVVVGFRVQAKPNESQSGKLCTMVQTDLEISLEPADEPAALKAA